MLNITKYLKQILASIYSKGVLRSGEICIDNPSQTIIFLWWTFSKNDTF
jgi:hypothetical protein